MFPSVFGRYSVKIVHFLIVFSLNFICEENKFGINEYNAAYTPIERLERSKISDQHPAISVSYVFIFTNKNMTYLHKINVIFLVFTGKYTIFEIIKWTKREICKYVEIH